MLSSPVDTEPLARSLSDDNAWFRTQRSQNRRLLSKPVLQAGMSYAGQVVLQCFLLTQPVVDPQSHKEKKPSVFESFGNFMTKLQDKEMAKKRGKLVADRSRRTSTLTACDATDDARVRGEQPQASSRIEAVRAVCAALSLLMLSQTAEHMLM